jgi:hypothetical protein
MILLAAAFALTFLMTRHRKQRDKADDYIVFYDMDGPRRIPRPLRNRPGPAHDAPAPDQTTADRATPPRPAPVWTRDHSTIVRNTYPVPADGRGVSDPAHGRATASPIAVDKTCSNQLGRVEGELDIVQDDCRASRGCAASMYGQRLRLECGRCVFEFDFERWLQTTYIGMPTFMNGMKVDFDRLQRGKDRWYTVRDADGELLVAVSTARRVMPPERDFFQPLAIEDRERGHVLRHAGQSTYLPSPADCISADGALYYIDTQSAFVVYSTRASRLQADGY